MYEYEKVLLKKTLNNNEQTKYDYLLNNNICSRFALQTSKIGKTAVCQNKYRQALIRGLSDGTRILVFSCIQCI